MLESIGDIFSAKQSGVRNSSDIKPIIEAWLQGQLQTDKVYCDDVSGGNVNVRVGGPVLYQEVLLQWDDCRSMLQQEYDYSVDTVAVTAAYY